MRLGELLLEYDRSKTVDRFGPALIQRITDDRSTHPMKYNAYNIALKDLLKQHLGDEDSEEDLPPEFDETHTELGNRYLLQSAMHFIEEADPTPTKEYVPWIITRYIKGGIKVFEDIQSTVAELLETFDAAKRSGYFRRQTDPEISALADIGRFKDQWSLGAFVRTLKPQDVLSNTAADKAKEKELLANDEAEILYNGARFKIIMLKSKDAAMFYGRSTQWCTAAKKNNMFASYDVPEHGPGGRLVVILDKPNNRRWQFHFGDGQFMDETDTPIVWTDFPEEVWSLIDWRPFLKGMQRYGCINMLQTISEDYLDDVIAECDTTSVVIAYGLSDRNGIRAHILRQYFVDGHFVGKPPIMRTGEGYVMRYWADACALDQAFQFEIKRDPDSPIWESIPGRLFSGKDGTMYEAIKTSLSVNTVMLIETGDDTLVITVTKRGHYDIYSQKEDRSTGDVAHLLIGNVFSKPPTAFRDESKFIMPFGIKPPLWKAIATVMYHVS